MKEDALRFGDYDKALPIRGNDNRMRAVFPASRHFAKEFSRSSLRLAEPWPGETAVAHHVEVVKCVKHAPLGGLTLSF